MYYDDLGSVGGLFNLEGGRLIHVDAALEVGKFRNVDCSRSLEKVLSNLHDRVMNGFLPTYIRKLV